jgi:hypothetical protein
VNAAKVITGTLYRVRHGRRKRLDVAPPPSPVVRPARVALMLALAHKVQEAIDTGKVPDRADVARMLGFTRARITHLLDLTLLAPDLQEQVLELVAVDGVEPMSERMLRTVGSAGSWTDQRRVWTTRLSVAPQRRQSDAGASTSDTRLHRWGC